MDLPVSTFLSVVKLEDYGNEIKQEPIDADMESEFVEVEDSLSVEDTYSEHGLPDSKECPEAHVAFSDDEITQSDRQFTYSNVDIGQRRRMRFSESDDLELLRCVASLNPYKACAIWREVAREVISRTGKNFTVRSIRDHTDLLMNTYVLRGIDACLKRTPPNVWEKKKQLINLVHSMWKRPTRSSASGAASNKVLRESSAADDQSGKKTAVTSETPSSNAAAPLKSSPSSPANALKSASTSPSVPILLQHSGVPLTLHFSSPVSSLPCPPLVATSTLTSKVQQLALGSPVSLQQLAVATGISSSALGKSQKLPPVLSPGSTSDPVGNTVSSDQPVSLSISSSSTPSEVVSSAVMVNRSTSPIQSFDYSSTDNASHCGSNASQSPSLSASVDSSTTGTSVEFHDSEQRARNRLLNKSKRVSSITRARLNFLQKRHRDQYTLKRRELDLEKRKLSLEEKKLSLEERKVHLQEEKWIYDKKEREEKLLMFSEEREHKMDMERRQQNMIDILVELRKKE